MIPTRMGPKDMEEIGEEIFDDFADALQLRPLERRCRDAMSWISWKGLKKTAATASCKCKQRIFLIEIWDVSLS